MNLNFRKHDKIIRTIPIPKWAQAPIGVLVLGLSLFVLFMFVYGAQWCGLWVVNALFHTHIQMTFLVWLIFTLLYFILGIFKFERKAT